MKKIIILSLFIADIFLICSKVQGSNFGNNDLTVKAEIRGCYFIPFNDDRVYHFLIELRLTNNKNSPIEFLTYTCGTAANVVIDNGNFDFEFIKCVNNQITTIKLDPHNEFSLMILVRTNQAYAFQTIKVGWRYVDFHNLQSYNNNYHEAIEHPRSKFENVLWSNPIDLNYPNTYRISK